MQPEEVCSNREILLPLPVYFIRSYTDTTVLVGINVRYTYTCISWFDTVKERRMTIKQVTSNSPEDFTFQRSEEEGGGIYHLTPMTLETYYESVKPNLAGGADFTDQSSMISAFLTTKNNFW